MSLNGRFGLGAAIIFGHLEILWGSFLGHFWVIVGSFVGNRGVIFGSFSEPLKRPQASSEVRARHSDDPRGHFDSPPKLPMTLVVMLNPFLLPNALY